MKPNVKMSEEDCLVSNLEKEEMANFPCRSVVGGLMYLPVCTWPHICHAELNRFTNNP